MEIKYGIIKPEEKVWTPEEILGWIKKETPEGNKCVGGMLVALFNKQTEDEQQIEETTKRNGVGFTGADANILTSFAKQFIRKGYLSTKQLALARKKLPKYRKQLAKIKNGDL